MSERETLLEFIVLGDFAKVCAVDAATGIEAIVVGPANAARHDLERLAIGKLKRRLADLYGPNPPSARDKKKGTVV